MSRKLGVRDSICTFYSPDGAGYEEPYYLEAGQTPSDLDIQNVVQNPLLASAKRPSTHGHVAFDSPANRTPQIRDRRSRNSLAGFSSESISPSLPADPDPVVCGEVDELLGLRDAVRVSDQFHSAKSSFEGLRGKLATYPRVLWLRIPEEVDDDSKFLWRVTLPTGLKHRETGKRLHVKKMMQTPAKMKIRDAIQKLFERHPAISSMLEQGGLSRNADDYILKETGFSEYLVGNYPFGSYDSITNARRNHSVPGLTLVPRDEAAHIFADAIIGEADIDAAMSTERAVSRLYDPTPAPPPGCIMAAELDAPLRVHVPALSPIVVSPSAHKLLYPDLKATLTAIENRCNFTAIGNCGMYQVGHAAITAQLVFGARPLCAPTVSQAVPVFVSLPAPPRPDPYDAPSRAPAILLNPVGWGAPLSISHPVSHIPADARIVFTVYITPIDSVPTKLRRHPPGVRAPPDDLPHRPGRGHPLGHFTVPVSTEEGLLPIGLVRCPLWLGTDGTPMSGCLQNRSPVAPQIATLRFPRFRRPVFMATGPDTDTQPRSSHCRRPPSPAVPTD